MVLGIQWLETLGPITWDFKKLEMRFMKTWHGLFFLAVRFETWHIGLIAGIVVLITSSRFLLLKSWSDFADSSDAANQQILTSLEPLNYLVVAMLPGISEEMLFRGALMPLVGTNWNGIVAAGLIFGLLHLGNGRKYSFAVWASIVGIIYGYAAVMSSSLLVPMASHSLNNLVGGLLWRYSSKLKSLE